MRKYIVLYADDMQMAADHLSLKELGLLLTALYAYACGEEPPELEPMVRIVFDIMKKHSEQYWEDHEENDMPCRRRGSARADSKAPKKAGAKPGKKAAGDADALFERLWAQYPNKKGKGKISDAKKRTLLEIGEEHMLRAIHRYIEEHNAKEKRGEFVPCWQNGSTFFNSGYVDYLDENYVAAPHEAQKPAATRSAFFCYEQSNTDWDEVFFQAMMLQEEEEAAREAKEASKSQKNAS